MWRIQLAEKSVGGKKWKYPVECQQNTVLKCEGMWRISGKRSEKRSGNDAWEKVWQWCPKNAVGESEKKRVEWEEDTWRILWMRKRVESGSRECKQNDVNGKVSRQVFRQYRGIQWNEKKEWKGRVSTEWCQWEGVSLEYSGKKWKKCGSGRLSVNIMLLVWKFWRIKWAEEWEQEWKWPWDYSGTQWKEKWKGKLGVSTYCCKWEVTWWIQCCRIQWNEKKK